MSLREDADKMIRAALQAALPDSAVREALDRIPKRKGRIILVAAGKAAWQMAKAASDCLGESIASGIVITKYGHSKGRIGNLRIVEAGHPVPDENSFLAAKEAIALVEGLSSEDTVLFLLSGGGSSLFELPLIPLEDLQRMTEELLSCGAEITEINTVRKRFSAVKGGRFAVLCAPAHVETIVLSDVLGDRLDMIASGPAYPDSSTSEEALEIVSRYHLTCTRQMHALLLQETPKNLPNVTTYVTGSVRQLCQAALNTCKALGYRTTVLTDRLSCTARDAGSFLASIAAYHKDTREPMAFILGGETTVQVCGTGLGGRNQELVLAAAQGISGLHACLFSLGSDGTDGPTDAAGGFADGNTYALLKKQGISPTASLLNNDAYHALKACGGLIFTGPTGTNVNDLTVLLLQPTENKEESICR